MQNEQSGSSSKRRDAANRLQEASSNGGKEQAGDHRIPSVRSPRRQTRHRGGSPGNVESGPKLVSSRPPALEYYRSDDDSASGEDTDADEMADEEYHSGEEEATADRSNADLSDISDSEVEADEEQQEDIDDSLQQGKGSSSGSSCKSAKRAASQVPPGNKRWSQKQEEQMQSTSGKYRQGRKRRHAAPDAQQELDCSSEQYAADVKRLRESKLKHNKNEQLRRKDMKDAVHKLRNQLRRKTKKPSTISVLKAAKQEINELTQIKVEEEKQLERLRQRELFLKYQLEALVSDHTKRQSSGGAGVIVSPVQHAGVPMGPSSFLQSPPTAAANPLNPPSLHSRPGLPQFPLFPVVPPPAVPHSTAAATSPTAIGRVGLIDCQQHAAAAAHANIITPGLTPISRLPLPQPPNLIPFTAAANLNPSTPLSRGSSTSPAGTAISIFPAAQAGSILPGVTPLHLVPPRTTTQHMYAGFPSPLIMPYPSIGRHPSPASVVGALTATHPGVGRLSMTPTFPLSFGYLPTALRPPTAIGIAGFGHYSATPVSQSNIRHIHFASTESPTTIHTNGRSRRSSGGERNEQTTGESANHHSSTGSKNGGVSAETYSPHTQSPSKVTSSASVRDQISAESRHISESSGNSPCTVLESRSRDSEEYSRLRAEKRRRSHDHNDDDDDSYSYSRTSKKRSKVSDRYNRNGVISVENTSKHLLPAAPPLLKMIDVEADSDTLGEKWSKELQQSCGRDQQQHHQCTLPPPPALKNAEAISTVIKHMQPQREIVSSSSGTGVGYTEKEDCSGLEIYKCRGGGEQRYRMSNSLSSSDEGPDSPQQRFNSLGQSTFCYNKLIGRDSLYLQVASKNSCAPSAGVAFGHRNSQYKTFRKKKSNLLRPNHTHQSIILQSTT